MELIIIGVIWVIAPIPLTILWLMNRNKAQKQKKLLQQLLEQHRILPDELTQAGLQIPAQKPPALPEGTVSLPQPAAPPLLQPGIPPLIQAVPPEDALSAAAARAAQIAEAEITGAQPAAMTPPESAAEQLGEIIVPQTDASNQTGEIILPQADAPNQTGEIILPQADASNQTGEIIIPKNSESAEQEAVSAPAADSVMPPQSQPPAPNPPQPAPAVPQLPNRISAITLMLSVGVLLVIFAGLIFVRTTWSKLTDGGRLVTLAAGSGLFFGTSALAKRIFKLNRTSMAFFTLGAAFLPISVWAAGYLKLLGEGLSGAGNPWLIALAFGSFTVISLIAALIYKQKGWGIAFLTGLTVSYISAAAAMTIYRKTSLLPFLIAIAIYALLIAIGTRILKPRIPAAIGSVLEPFAIVIAVLSALTAFSVVTSISFTSLILHEKPESWLYAIPALISAFTFFAPVLSDRLEKLIALPVTLLSVPAFAVMLLPLRQIGFSFVMEERTTWLSGAYFALILMLCAAIWLILLLTNSLPDDSRKGFFLSAFVLSAAAIPMQLLRETYLTPKVSIILAAATVILTAGWCYASRKKDSLPVHILISTEIWSLCMIAVDAIGGQTKLFPQNLTDLKYLLQAGCFLLGFAALFLLKKHRTGISDLLLTVSPVIPLLTLINKQPLQNRLPIQFAGIALLAVLILLYWALAFAHDTRKPQQYAFAALSPVLLALTAISAADGLLENVRPVFLLIGWSILSFALGTAAYLTTKRRFHGVRKLLFGLTMVPPLLMSQLCGDLERNNWFVLLLVICAAAAAGLWMLFSARGFRALAITSFSAALFLLIESTLILVSNQIYNGRLNYTALMIASLWVLLFSLLAIAVARKMLFFVGGNVIADVMQFAAPLTVLILSVMLLVMDSCKWESFYFVYVFGLCILAWFTTKKTQIILPAVCALSLVFSVEALRWQTFGISYGSVIIILLGFAGMTILFPYLGIVSREMDEEHTKKRRSWVLTGLGGIVPVWLLIAACRGNVDEYFTNRGCEWMNFFVPVLFAGFLLHFLIFEKDAKRRRLLITTASGLGVIAFWMQPVVDVTGTWFAGRLHIVPLIAFGLVLRYLYGERYGGIFLFCVGVYTMLRLTVTAIRTEAAEDLLTLLAAAFIMFVSSFYIKQKKWFLLGGISLILTAVYMHMKLTDGRQWWVYLLAAGLVLIVVAGSNEMLKQRGDSLKSKAGRLWEEWTW